MNKGFNYLVVRLSRRVPRCADELRLVTRRGDPESSFLRGNTTTQTRRSRWLLLGHNVSYTSRLRPMETWLLELECDVRPVDVWLPQIARDA